ncbi:MAG: hypothetical protein AAFY34_08445 [Pseudomonadota bacterium]
MQEVAVDFEKRVDRLTRKNRRTTQFMMLLISSAAVSYAIFIIVQFTGTNVVSSYGPLDGVLGDSAGNALWVANNLANLAATLAVRIWFIRERKMTLLLSHAMVLEDDADIAMRMLLNEDTEA